MALFQVKNNDFYMNEEPVRLISGAIHYFRVVPEYWQDRLQKLKACGFNTVETYVPWNFHEPKEGQFNFSGMADLERFIQLAGEVGLYVIVRPSPYICAEWEFGGLPAWLLADPSMRLRCMHQPFLDKVDAYYDVLLLKLKPLLCTNGGPIIALQIENEYGSYGNDHEYLEYLKDAMIKRGMDVLLFTSDGPEHHMLQGGMITGVLETVNFGSKGAEAFEMLRRYQPEGPLMCMEFWNGWFDHWGEEHHTRAAADAAQALDEILAAGGSVNFYMFHGGTNFGFTSGANCPQRDKHEPTITSYDYDVPLNESGEPTDKYFAVRDVLSRYVELPKLELPQPIPKQAYGTVAVTGTADLLSQLDRLSVPVRSACPEPMEYYGQNDGFILYETHISGPRVEQELVLQDVRDRALVFVDDEFKGIVQRGESNQPISFAIPEGGVRLRVLVENMGRINYGPYMMDRKGISEGIRLGNQFLFGWTVRPLPLDDLSGVTFDSSATAKSQPAFYRASLTIEGEPADTFLRFDGWTKGVIYVNGFNLGRYWNRGPQRTLYVPAPLLRSGANEIVIFELHGTKRLEIMFDDRPELG